MLRKALLLSAVVAIALPAAAAQNRQTSPFASVVIDGSRYGSATLVATNDGRGLLVTAAHVPSGDNNRPIVTFPSGERFQGSLAPRDGMGDDLSAILIPRPRKAQPILIGTFDAQSPAYTMYGYGGTNRLFQSSGRYVGQVKYEGPYAQARFDFVAKPGDSGGAVVDARGELVGVIVRSSPVGGYSTAVVGLPLKNYVARLVSSKFWRDDTRQVCGGSGFDDGFSGGFAQTQTIAGCGSGGCSQGFSTIGGGCSNGSCSQGFSTVQRQPAFSPFSTQIQRGQLPSITAPQTLSPVETPTQGGSCTNCDQAAITDIQATLIELRAKIDQLSMQQGERGPQGPKGPKGDKGDSGNAPSAGDVADALAHNQLFVDNLAVAVAANVKQPDIQQAVDDAVAKALDHDTPVRVYTPDGQLVGESKTNIFKGGAIDLTFDPRKMLDQ